MRSRCSDFTGSDEDPHGPERNHGNILSAGTRQRSVQEEPKDKQELREERYRDDRDARAQEAEEIARQGAQATAAVSARTIPLGFASVVVKLTFKLETFSSKSAKWQLSWNS